MITYSICAESKAPMLACLVENPLVAMVVSPWLKASNHPMPHIFKDIVHAVVSNMYIPKIHREPTVTRECTFRRLTPVDSAAKSWTLSMPNMGRIATVKNTSYATADLDFGYKVTASMGGMETDMDIDILDDEIINEIIMQMKSFL